MTLIARLGLPVMAPRKTDWLGSRKLPLDLGCPEVIRLELSSTKPGTFVTTNEYTVDEGRFSYNVDG